MNCILSTIKYAVKEGIIRNCERKEELEAILALEYMSFFTIRVFEKNFRTSDKSRYRFELLLNSGVNLNSPETAQNHSAPMN